MGVANVVSKACWIRNLMFEPHISQTTTTLVYCDNVSAIYLSCNQIQHQRTKHIEPDIHFVQEKVARGQVRIFHIPSRYQVADIFTKGLPLVLFGHNTIPCMGNANKKKKLIHVYIILHNIIIKN